VHNSIFRTGHRQLDFLHHEPHSTFQLFQVQTENLIIFCNFSSISPLTWVKYFSDFRIDNKSKSPLKYQKKDHFPHSNRVKFLNITIHPFRKPTFYSEASTFIFLDGSAGIVNSVMINIGELNSRSIFLGIQLASSFFSFAFSSRVFFRRLLFFFTLTISLLRFFHCFFLKL